MASQEIIINSMLKYKKASVCYIAIVNGHSIINHSISGRQAEVNLSSARKARGEFLVLRKKYLIRLEFQLQGKEFKLSIGALNMYLDFQLNHIECFRYDDIHNLTFINTIFAILV